MTQKLDWIGGLERPRRRAFPASTIWISIPHPSVQQRVDCCGVQQTSAQGPGIADGLRYFWSDEM